MNRIDYPPAAAIAALYRLDSAQCPLTGTEIYTQVADRSRTKKPWGPATIYKALTRLEASGHVRTEPKRKHPNSKTSTEMVTAYVINDSGRNLLAAAIRLHLEQGDAVIPAPTSPLHKTRRPRTLR